jgi:hypothetical protein
MSSAFGNYTITGKFVIILLALSFNIKALAIDAERDKLAAERRDAKTAASGSRLG